ncbi:MAG: riboflavin synthase [Cyanobacteria bacterium J06641_5]
MFTGLVRAQGSLSVPQSDRLRISLPVGATAIVAELEYGDSVAVDGACLTVEAIFADGFIAAVSPETLQRTNLGWRDRTAARANIEPALRVGDKLGGHFVSGHIDGVGCLLESMQTASAWEMTFGGLGDRPEQWQQIARTLIPKGSIAVNGVSLTVAACTDDWFKVAVIPATYRDTNLSLLQPGAWVNLEGDILGKYVAKLLAKSDRPQAGPAIDLGFLAEHGYL